MIINVLNIVEYIYGWLQNCITLYDINKDLQ
jgi:hypothetical protein